MQVNKIIVIPWQAEWQERFEQLRDSLLPNLEGLICSVEHVGSTSVPGLAAKPILDVDVVIPNQEVFEKVKAMLEEIGYFHRGDLGVNGREAFGYNEKPELMRHHLYVLAQDSEELRRHLGFRDWLGSHPEDAAEYGKVKLTAAERFPADIDAYIEAKSDFILQIYQKAGLVDSLDIFSNAWSVLINRYGLRVTALECQKLDQGLSGCLVTTPDRTYYLLAWEKSNSKSEEIESSVFDLESSNIQPIPTASGKPICELSQLRFVLFDSEEKASIFLDLHTRATTTDNTQKFIGKAKIYQEARPGYSPALFAFLQQVFGVGKGSVVADVGSGTGILTRQLLEMGVKVFAVEPNVDMRQIAEQELAGIEGFVSVHATAEQTNLPDGSFDFIFAASAFHWFDPVAFKVECKRILKPGGKVFLIWNESQMTDEINQGRKAIFEKYSPRFIGFSGGHKDSPGVKEKFFDGQIAEMHFPNPISYDRNRFIGRALSSSYSLTESDENYEAHIAELGKLFDRFSVDGVITVPQETVLYYKTKSPTGHGEPI